MSLKNRELISTGNRLVELLADIQMICERAESRIEKLPGWESRLCRNLRELLKARWQFRNMLGNDADERLVDVCERNPNSYAGPDTFNAPLVLWKVVEKVDQALWDAAEGSEFGPWSWDVQQNGTLPMELHPNTISRFTIRVLEALAPIDLDRLGRSTETQLALMEADDATAKELPVTLKPLSPTAAITYEILLELPPHCGMTAPRILDAIREKDPRKLVTAETLRGGIRKELLPYGLENAPRIGYRIKPDRRPR